MPHGTCPDHGPMTRRPGHGWRCKPCEAADSRKRRAAKKDDVPVTEGFRVHAISTLYDEEGGAQLKWVKETRESGGVAALLEAIQGIAEPFKGKSELVDAPPWVDDDLITIYPIGDPHFGMHAWAPEAGEDFDLKIAEADLVAAMDRLVAVAPSSETCIIAPLGDTFHVDSDRNTTTAGTPQDVDTRTPKVLRVVVRVMRRLIDRAKEKHRKVYVKIVRGNHDEEKSMVLAVCLGLYYENDPRVEVDQSPAHFHWHRFGKCLFGFTHTHLVKSQYLPGVMANDRKEDWGETDYRHFFGGHIHHDTVKEYPGVTVETFRTLAPKDKYHASHGYRSGRDMKCDVWHREYGHQTRHTVGIMQLRGGR